MPNTKEIKGHMSSIRDTQKITNAMYLIASTKMRKAKEELDKSRPYFEALKGEIKRIFRTSRQVTSKYFYPPDGSAPLNGTYGCLVITADKGLAGAYNQNVIREALRLMEDHPDTKLFVVGEYGRQYFMRHRIPIEKSFLYTAQNPTMQRAREISSLLLERFNAGQLDKIFVVYTDLQSSLREETICTRLLPFHRAHFDSVEEEQAAVRFNFQPSIEEVLDAVMPSYISGFIYSALVDSFCSEQNARIEAMSAANSNAEGILTELAVQYNRVRQANITREITEVSSGAKAQKRKKQTHEVTKG